MLCHLSTLEGVMMLMKMIVYPIEPKVRVLCAHLMGTRGGVFTTGDAGMVWTLLQQPTF